MTLFQGRAPEPPEPLKLIFDENISPKAVRALAGLLIACRDTTQVISIVDHKAEWGSLDHEWIPKIKSSGWIVITCDRGKTNRGQRLPRICVDAGVRHVLIGNKLHHMPQLQKIRAILLVWGDICKIPDAPAGSRFRLRLHGASRVPHLEQLG